jgi:xanthine dehydrogenase accessory factor
LASNAGSDNKFLLVTTLHSEAVFKWLLKASNTYPIDLPPPVSDHLDNGISAEESFQIIGDSDKESYLIERLNDRRIPLYLFGAGHVAKAVVEELSRQPFSVLWIDSRSEQFPTRVPANTTIILSNESGAECESAPDDAIFLIMTHSHELDEDLCFKILKRKETQWLGLIGSETKRKRFEHRLLKRGLSRSDTDKLACPVGMSGITGKRPATIAVSIAAQLLQDRVPEHWR